MLYRETSVLGMVMRACLLMTLYTQSERLLHEGGYSVTLTLGFDKSHSEFIRNIYGTNSEWDCIVNTKTELIT